MRQYLYVYILLCSDNSYYTGVTNNLERRILEHNTGINPKCYTYSRRPLQLVFYEYYSDFNLAIYIEKKIKKWSRAKKQALISGDWEKLKNLSKCKNSSSSEYYNQWMYAILTFKRFHSRTSSSPACLLVPASRQAQCDPGLIGWHHFYQWKRWLWPGGHDWPRVSSRVVSPLVVILSEVEGRQPTTISLYPIIKQPKDVDPLSVQCKGRTSTSLSVTPDW